MTARQSLRRLLVVNGVTACLLAIGLVMESLVAPAMCLLLLTFSTIGAARWFDRNASKDRVL